MNRQTKRSLEPSAIPKRTQKQQVLCDAIEQNYQNLERTIQVYVSRTIKNFGNKFDLYCDRNSIQTIATEILQDTIETVLNKSEEFDPSYPPLPWIKKFAVNKARGWKRDKDRQSDKIIPINNFSSPTEGLSEEEILGKKLSIFSKLSKQSDPIELEKLLSLVNESDRQILRLAFIEDLSGKDLAAALGISEGAVYTKKSRAIAKLRKAYTQKNSDDREGK